MVALEDDGQTVTIRFADDLRKEQDPHIMKGIIGNVIVNPLY